MLAEAFKSVADALQAMSAEEIAEELAKHDDDDEEDAGEDLSMLDPVLHGFVNSAKSKRVRLFRKTLAMLRTGKALSENDTTQLSKAAEAHERAMKHQKAVADNHTSTTGHMNEMGDQQAAAEDGHTQAASALQEAVNNPDDAAKHVKRAAKALDKSQEAFGNMTRCRADMQDAHEDAIDSHNSEGRSLKSAQRCVRAVLDGAVAKRRCRFRLRTRRHLRVPARAEAPRMTGMRSSGSARPLLSPQSATDPPPTRSAVKALGQGNPRDCPEPSLFSMETTVMKLAELLKKSAAALEAFTALAGKDTKTEEDWKQLPEMRAAVTTLDREITLAKEVEDMQRASATTTVAGQFNGDARITVTNRDPYTDETAAKEQGVRTSKGLRAIASLKLFTYASGNMRYASELATQKFGENHPITRGFLSGSSAMERALIAGIGASGGYIVPPDYVAEIIELLRPASVVRTSDPRVIPMPRGTLTLPGQASAATASYGTETGVIATSQPVINEIVASYKKLKALVPVSNDLLRYADPAADAFVRDDLVKVIAP